MENYIVINGKKAELTEEQLKALGLETETNPFEREIDKMYYHIDSRGRIDTDLEMDSPYDNGRWEAANYCTDREMLQQQAYRETLNRLLWRYSMEHKGNEINWDDDTEKKYQILYNYHAHTWMASYNTYYQSLGAIYFVTQEIAESAIREIVEPFMAEHPDFKF